MLYNTCLPDFQNMIDSGLLCYIAYYITPKLWLNMLYNIDKRYVIQHIIYHMFT